MWEAIASPRAIASYKLTIGASLAAASVNAVFGLLVAWVLVRYRFPGKRIADAMIDLPFALPTAVAGIALTTVYSREGFLGRHFDALGRPGGVHAARHRARVDVRRLAVRGAHGGSRCCRISKSKCRKPRRRWAHRRGRLCGALVLPTILPALLAGFTMAFARALGEYGSVVFISGNLPMKTEITTLLIMTKLEQYDYTGAAAIAVVMLMFSVSLLLALNLLQTWSRRRPA